jgi:hypothetical protein
MLMQILIPIWWHLRYIHGSLEDVYIPRPQRAGLRLSQPKRLHGGPTFRGVSENSGYISDIVPNILLRNYFYSHAVLCLHC